MSSTGTSTSSPERGCSSTGRWSRSGSGGTPELPHLLVDAHRVGPGLAGGLHRGPGDGGERHGQDRADDAGDDGPRGEREQDDERVQRQVPAHEDGLEEVALDLLHADDDRQHDERVDEPAGHERDEDRDGAGRDRTDDGHEGRDERQQGQRQRERDADEGHDRHR